MNNIKAWLLFTAVLGLIAFLSGCASEPIIEVRYVRQEIPASLLTCKPAPEIPGAGATQREVAGFIVDLYDSGEDCRSSLQAVASFQ